MSTATASTERIQAELLETQDMWCYSCRHRRKAFTDAPCKDCKVTQPTEHEWEEA